MLTSKCFHAGYTFSLSEYLYLRSALLVYQHLLSVYRSKFSPTYIKNFQVYTAELFGHLNIAISKNDGFTNTISNECNVDPIARLSQRRPECTGNSSSDENRSSGHASMSDTGGHTSSSSPPHRHHRSHSPQQLNAVPEDDRLSASVTQRNGKSRSGQSRNRHRATPAKVPTFVFFFSSKIG